MKIDVQLCSNTIKKYDLGMVVDVSGVGEEILSLPIAARCIIPQITVITPIMDFGRCFLHHPYEHHIKVQNDSDLPAKYELMPQEFDDITPIIHSSPQVKVTWKDSLCPQAHFISEIKIDFNFLSCFLLLEKISI